MNTKEFTQSVEDYVNHLATTHTYNQDKQQVALLRDMLLKAAMDILKEKLTEKRAEKFADQIYMAARKERKQRLKEAASAAAAAVSNQQGEAV